MSIPFSLINTNSPSPTPKTSKQKHSNSAMTSWCNYKNTNYWELTITVLNCTRMPSGTLKSVRNMQLRGVLTFLPIKIVLS